MSFIVYRTGRRPPRRTLHLCVLAVLVGCLGGLAFGLAIAGYYIFFGGNLHIVLPEQCYRCAQPTAESLTQLTRKYGIRTLLNLRGRNEAADWYQAERRCAADLGVELIDVTLSSIYVPTEGSMANLICILDQCVSPCLMHCYGGADRTGFVAACFLLLRTDADLATARRQLGIRFGHNPFGASSCLTCVLDYYGRWLARQGRVHSPENFRYWASNVYSSREITRHYCLPARPAADRDPPYYECSTPTPLAGLSPR